MSLPSALRADTDGHRTLDVAPGSGACLADVLAEVFARFPRLRQRVLDDAGQVRRFVNVFVGDDECRTCGGLSAPVPDGTVVTIVGSVAGG